MTCYREKKAIRVNYTVAIANHIKDGKNTRNNATQSYQFILRKNIDFSTIKTIKVQMHQRQLFSTVNYPGTKSYIFHTT